MSRRSHPSVGRDPLLAWVTIVLLVVLSIGAVLQYVLGAYVFVDDRFLGLTWLFDGFVGVLILAIGISWILAMLYEWANGGPVLAVALALVPSLLALVIRLEFAVNVDLGMAFAAATVAVWLGAWSAFPPGDPPAGAAWVAALGGIVTGSGAFVIWRGTAGVGPHAETAALVAVALFAVGVGTGLVWAVAHWRALGWPDWRRGAIGEP